MSMDELWMNTSTSNISSFNSSVWNISLTDYLLAMRGPQYLSPNVVLPITVIYCVIFLTGVLGNLAICIVIYKNENMRTTTNYYLFSLAVSDVTLLLFGKLLLVFLKGKEHL